MSSCETFCTETCEECGCDLDAGQIGKCDDCRPYTFEDLDDRAKERARDWWRSVSDFEPEMDDYVSTLTMLGYDVDTRSVRLMSGKSRQEPDIHYSVGGGGHDYACFDGVWRADKLDLARLQAEHGNEELLTLGAELMALVLRWPKCKARIVASGTASGIDWAYAHGDSADDDDEDDVEFSALIEDVTQRVYNWLCRDLNEQYDAENSEDYIDECIVANEYEFNEDGSRA